ncbi:bifunctional DNA primase/polymerase [Mesorhizobium sp. LHD-90]|uniref:bifunctional DNA primase/polymerase n=1 Tax=Mesorhizobium sp. LHD-90 TaxID=3071414 RepID=UPI0027DFDA66|nr:bifunctional DNA primase/polymerase [Mesorhizobium sp. LHD-90]MDQ6433635.1 bifunctional DNA primase/polymerase [Mesorhizobium sp. LHD-90]
MSIFATEAPLYWKAGLPAIPLLPRQKRPAINRWQLYCDTFPTEEERQTWMASLPDGNIGLPMGSASGLVAIDIDTDDEKVIEVLDRVLPKSPWRRVGKKGEVRIYRYNDERTTRIKDADGAMICEVLSKGTQFVLPPSIHPDTGRPYTANAELYEVYKSAPALPKNVEIEIRAALRSVGIEASTGSNAKIATFVPAGSRDNAMTWHAGLLARVVLKGERSLLQALGEMETWVNTYTEQVVGDALSVDKARSKVVEFLNKDLAGDTKNILPTGWDEGLSDEDKERLGLAFTEDDEVWTAQQIIAALEQKVLADEDPLSPDREAANTVALQRVVRSRLSPVGESMVINYMVGMSEGAIRVGDARRQLKQMQSEGTEGDNHTEIAQAALEHISRFGELRHYADHFWQWGGSHWEQRPDSQIVKLVAEKYGNLPTSKKNADYKGVKELIATFASKAIEPRAGVNFVNGFLGEDLELCDHNPEFGMTYTLPLRYLPETAGDFPLFSQLMVDAWGKDPDYEQKVMALQEALGATIMQRATAFQRAILLFGKPNSGKSTLLKVLKSLIPAGASAAIPPESWADKFLPAQMFGKIFNFAGELSETQFIPGKQFKEIVTGEEVTGQHKNGQPFKFSPVAAHWFLSNHIPRTKDPSDGFNRRWLVLPFSRRLNDARKRPDFDREIIASDAEAIVAWGVEGYRRLRGSSDYTLPSSHTAFIGGMSSANNSVRHFLQRWENVVTGVTKTTSSTSSDVLFADYSMFAMRHISERAVTQQKFEEMMDELDEPFDFEIVLTDRGGKIYRGVELKKPVAR